MKEFEALYLADGEETPCTVYLEVGTEVDVEVGNVLMKGYVAEDGIIRIPSRT